MPASWEPSRPHPAPRPPAGTHPPAVADTLRTFRFQSDTHSRLPAGSARRPSRPDLGIFVPPLSSAALSTASNSPIRRKPLPGSATTQSHSQSRSRASSHSSAGTGVYPPRSSSLKSASLSPKGRSYTISSPDLPNLDFVVRDLDRNPHGATPPTSGTLNNKPASLDHRLAHNSSTRNEVPSALKHETKVTGTSFKTNPYTLSGPSAMASSPERAPGLQIDITRVEGSPPSLNNANRPRSPGAALQDFFGWSRRDGSASDSPSASPLTGSPQKGSPQKWQLPLRHANTMPTSLDIPKANAFAVGPPGSTLLPTPPASNSQVSDLERELKELSAELANSIRREMELEDEVDRLKSLSAEQPSETPRRSSDYFSDSGASSSRYGDTDPKLEEMERMKRKTELEMAQMKLDMSEKMAEVLKKRRLAEDRIQLLEEHVQTMPKSPSPMMGSSTDRAKQLERLLEDAKRKILEEKKSRDNMEELIGGMRHEIQQYRTERDNYRNEVVPQLVSKVSSLEMFIAQGELISPLEKPEGFAEEDPISPLTQAGLSRARSISNLRNAAARSRSNTMQNRTRSRANSSVREYASETREQLLDRVKDMESQKDALHKALKSLLDRHHLQNKQYSKRVLALEKERDRALFGGSRHMGFHRKVKTLKDEILTLRQRADDALDQKWHCEQELDSVQADLDRAQRETSATRQLLQEQADQLPAIATAGAQDEAAALNKAYQELQTTHALSMVHLKDLETPKPFGPRVQSGAVLALLKRSISDAETERDVAQRSAEKYREQARQLQKSDLQHLSTQQNLAADLFAAAGRMDELVDQVRLHMSGNAALRQRLVEAVERGEREHAVATARVAELQARLRGREHEVLAAQTAAQAALGGHEADVRALGEGQRRQLQRSLGRVASIEQQQQQHSSSESAQAPPHLPSPSPALALPYTSSSTIFHTRSPRLASTPAGTTHSLHHATGTAHLETSITALEHALRDATIEMRIVAVDRTAAAQRSLAALLAEREEARVRSGRLQEAVVAERALVQRLMR